MFKLLVFVSSTCPHCPDAEKVAREAVREYGSRGLSLEKIKVRTRDGKQMAAELNVKALPTIILTKEGVETKRFVGIPDKSKLINEVEKALGLKKSFFSKILGG